MKKQFLLGLMMMFSTSISAQANAFSLYQDGSKNPSQIDLSTKGYSANHEWVDFGLSVKWATECIDIPNHPYGEKFAWGETTPKTVTYSWSSYKYCNGNNSQGELYIHFYKYCFNYGHQTNGFHDDKTILDSIDDAAIANWGNGWRMPTKEEVEELLSNTTQTWMNMNGQNGYKIVGANGNDIFIPITKDNVGRYWTKTCPGYLDGGASGVYSNLYAFTLSFSQNGIGTARSKRYDGLRIFPVCELNNNEKVIVTLEVDGNMSSSTITCLKNAELTITAVPNEHCKFMRWSDGNTDNPRTITTNEDINLTAYFAKEQYEITGNCSNGHIEGLGLYDYGAEVELTVVPDEYCHFKQWSDGNTNNPRLVTVKQGSNYYYAYCERDMYSVNIKSGGNGTVNENFNMSLPAGSRIMAYATPNDGFYFINWSNGNTENPFYFILERDTILTAYFAPIQYYIVTISSNNRSWGYAEIIHDDGTKTTTGGEYITNTKLKMNAYPTDYGKYEFVEWSDGYKFDSRSITVTENLNYIANFRPIGEGIEDVLINDISQRKIIINDQIYILRNGKVYTITGAEVK